VVTVVALAGFGLTLAIFYPGILTYDARYVYLDMKAGRAGDWQSPVMGWLWSLVDPLAPGTASLFLLSAFLYWLGFALLALFLARRSLGLGLLTLALAATPPALALVGVLWRDVLLAELWLLAIVLALIASERDAPVANGRGHFVLSFRLAHAAALALVALGVLLRPNALPAAPILVAYLFWPRRLTLTRMAVVYLPAALGFVLLIQAVYYGMFGATRQYPWHSILVFDLGGISHFAGENQFPLAWTEKERDLIVHRCYEPTLWDIYWTREPCSFVMAKLEGDEKVFGTPRLAAAWWQAVKAHPLAYLRHRAAFMQTFLFGSNLVMWTKELDQPFRTVFADRPAFTAFRTLHDWLLATPIFRVATWLIACVLLFAAAWRRRMTPAGAFVVASCGSAIAYIASYALVGVAPDFRYAYWAVLAALGSFVVTFAPALRRTPECR
jgi:hypothetical protein